METISNKNQLRVLAELEKNYSEEVKELRQLFNDNRNNESVTKGMSELEFVLEHIDGFREGKKLDAERECMDFVRRGSQEARNAVIINEDKGCDPTPTGFPFLDAATNGGIEPGISIIGGRSSIGKTSFTLQTATQIATAGYPVAYMSLEMDKVNITARQLSFYSRYSGEYSVPMNAFANAKPGYLFPAIPRPGESSKQHKYRSAMEAAILRSEKEVKDTFFTFDREDIGAQTTENIISAMEKFLHYVEVTNRSISNDELKLKRPFFVVDYLQYISLEETAKVFSERGVLDAKMLPIHDFALANKVPILVISSISREFYDKPFSIKAFKDSGNIEYYAQALFGLQWKGTGEPGFNLREAETKPIREIELVVLKHRSSGALGNTFDFEYNPRINYWHEVRNSTPWIRKLSSFSEIHEERKEYSATNRALQETMERLETEVQAVFESEKYKAWLNTLSKFHNYSLNNTLLIAMQKPDASLVAGFTAWKNRFGRHVKAGEKGIKIIAPAPYKAKVKQEKINPKTHQPIIGSDGKPETEVVEVTRPAFKVVSVFDISQTEGKELPQLSVTELSGDVQDYQRFFSALTKCSPAPISVEDIQSETSAKGYFTPSENKIVIRDGMSQIQTVKTLIHEMTHATLHNLDQMKDSPKDHSTREVEAESVAYAVCAHYGIDTGDYSFGYVAGWSSGKDTKELKASLETIQKTASDLISKIDEKLKEVEKEHAAEKQDVPAQTASVLGALADLQKAKAEEAREYRYECTKYPANSEYVPYIGFLRSEPGEGRFGVAVYNRPLYKEELNIYGMKPLPDKQRDKTKQEVR